MCDYSEESKSYRVWSSKNHRVVESKNFPLIETPPHLLLPPSKLSPMQDMVPPSWDLDDDTLGNDYISYNDLLRDVRGYTGALDFNINIPANHENAGSVSADPYAQGLVDQIPDLTSRKDLVTSAAPLPRAASPAEHLPGAARKSLSGGAPPPRGEEASSETERLSPAPLAATARKGAPMRDNKIDRPNVVTQGAAAEPTGVVTRDRRVRCVPTTTTTATLEADAGRDEANPAGTRVHKITEEANDKQKVPQENG